MIKLIASDLDGTLLPRGDKSLDPRLFDLIAAFKERGVHFVVASGRQLLGLQRLFAPVGTDISYISENGAVCMFQGEKYTSILKEIDRDLAVNIIRSIQEIPTCHPMISCSKTCYIRPGNEAFVHQVQDLLGYDTTLLDDLTLIPEPIVKLALLDASGTYAAVPHLREKYGDKMRVLTTGNDWIDFMPYDIHKGKALSMIMDKLGILPEEVIAFGDQENDMEMLSLAGTGYAMEYSAPEVKKCAAKTTDSVIKELEKLLDTL